jgi:hypothetical protein
MLEQKKIVKLLELIVKLGVGYNEKVIEYAMPDKPPMKIRTLGCVPEALEHFKDLISSIKNNPNLNAIFGNKLYNLGDIYTEFKPESLGVWLLTRTIQSCAVNAVDELDKFVKLGYTPAFRIMSISGLRMEGSIRINDNLSLISIEELRESYQKFQAAPKQIPDTSFRGGSYTADSKYPTVTLKKSIRIQTTKEQQALYSKEDDDELEEFCAFLVLHNKASPMIFHEWTELEERVPRPEHHLSGFHGGGSELNYLIETSINETDWTSLAPLYNKYIKLSHEDRVVIKVALFRIRNSKVRWNVTDRAIDLAIALESILLTKKQEDKLRFKFSDRASYLLHQSTEERSKLTHLFKKLYDCRSDAVHNGEVKKHYNSFEQEPIKVAEFLDVATEHSIQIFKNIILLGSIPDWIKINTAP